MSKRDLMLVNAGFRIAYGAGDLLLPAAMGKLQSDPAGGLVFSAAGVATAAPSLTGR